ncbi:Uncharacterised protein [Mycobacteroides abscessus subsp. abscessus]|nr:Uncharacterised protein [Mycobacteroides abscessus subsp. abscessus]
MGRISPFSSIAASTASSSSLPLRSAGGVARTQRSTPSRVPPGRNCMYSRRSRRADSPVPRWESISR